MGPLPVARSCTQSATQEVAALFAMPRIAIILASAMKVGAGLPGKVARGHKRHGARRWKYFIGWGHFSNNEIGREFQLAKSVTYAAHRFT